MPQSTYPKNLDPIPSKRGLEKGLTSCRPPVAARPPAVRVPGPHGPRGPMGPMGPIGPIAPWPTWLRLAHGPHWNSYIGPQAHGTVIWFPLAHGPNWNNDRVRDYYMYGPPLWAASFWSMFSLSTRVNSIRATLVNLLLWWALFFRTLFCILLVYSNE